MADTGLGLGRNTGLPSPGGSGGGSSSARVETLLVGWSTTTDQQPATRDSPIQVEFGPAQLGPGDPIQLGLDGTVTINQAGTYNFTLTLQLARAGTPGDAVVFGRVLINGAEHNITVMARLTDDKIVTPTQFAFARTLGAGDVLTVEIYRDSQGINEGGLIAGFPTLIDWRIAPTAVLAISRLVPASTPVPGDGKNMSRYVLVKNVGDFPPPTNDIIKLDADVNYEINGVVDLGNLAIDGNGANKLFGISPATDGLITNREIGLIGGLDATLTLGNLKFSNPLGPIFNVGDSDGGEGIHAFFATNCTISDCIGIGEFRNLEIVEFQKCLFANLEGSISFTGVFNEGIRIDGCLATNTVTGTLIDLGTAVIGAASFDHNFIQASPGLVFLSGLPDSGNIQAGGNASVIGNITYGGNAASIIGVKVTDDGWNFAANNTVPDSKAIGSMTMADNTTNTTISSAGVAVKIAGVTLAGENISRFDQTANNQLTYTGNKAFYGTAIVSASIARQTSLFDQKSIRVWIYQNGVAKSSQGTVVDTIAQSLTVLGDVIVQPGDVFEVWVSNDTDSNNLICTQLQVSIS